MELPYILPFYQIETGCLRADVDCDGDVDVMDVQKVASKFNTNYTAYEQDGTNPITAVDVMLVAEKWLWEGAGGGQQVVKTYSLGGRTVAVRRGSELTYVFQDHLGSPALETDTAGVPGTRWTYEPYGTMRGSEWTLPIDRGFTGQTIEQGLGLHDYGARHYAQPLGRWIAPDTIVPNPADPQSLNRYSYVGNRPTSLIDPTGNNPACASVPHPIGAFACYVFDKVVQYGPQVAALAQQLAVNLQQLGRVAAQMPAAMDANNVPNQAPQSSNAGGTGDSGGLDPNDPFRNAGESIRQGVETLRRQIASASNYTTGRYGAQAHLSRAEYYQRQGLLESVNPTGSGSIDLILTNNTGVEVKYWSAQYLANNAGKLASQLQEFKSLNLDRITVEFVQTQGQPISEAMLSEIQALLLQYGVDLTNITFSVVTNPGIP